MEERNLLILSDLHLCEGMDPKTGKFSRLEDFLFDDAFVRFLHYHERVKEQPRFGGRPWLLILNGDLFDFLQVVSLPPEGRSLQAVKGVRHHAGLRPNEQDFGLGTTVQEVKWKLRRVAQGHQRFFAALGWFVARGNHVALVKGNHDIELHWPQVREQFVAEVKRAYTRERLMLDHGPPIALEEIKARIRYHPWFYYEPGRVYVEHGCQYEAASYYPNYLHPELPTDPERIRLPWGSLFVRYLFNKVEDVHPFADNVRPATRYVMWAFRKSPMETMGLLVTRGGAFLRAFWNVGKKMAQGASWKSEPSAQSGQADPRPLPAEVTEQIAALARERFKASWREWAGSLLRGVFSLLTTLSIALIGVALLAGEWWLAGVSLAVVVVLLILRHWFGRRFNHSFEDYMVRAAQELEQTLSPDHPVRYIILGHDHKPALERLERAWYVNTGAWVLVYDREGPIEGREQLSFFRLAWGYEGTPELLHWDDAAGAPARVKLGLEI